MCESFARHCYRMYIPRISRSCHAITVVLIRLAKNRFITAGARYGESVYVGRLLICIRSTLGTLLTIEGICSALSITSFDVVTCRRDWRDVRAESSAPFRICVGIMQSVFADHFGAPTEHFRNISKHFQNISEHFRNISGHFQYLNQLKASGEPPRTEVTPVSFIKSVYTKTF